MNILRKYHWLAVLLLYSIAVFYITFPLFIRLDTLITGFGDELLISWIHNWVVHALLTDPISLFNANIYYPFQNTLAYSDIFLVTSVIGAPILLLLQEPITIVNFTIIVSLLSLGFAVYLLAYYLTKDSLSAFISGLIIIFSPAVLDKFVHIQILAIAFVPLSILFLLQFLNKRKTKYLLFCLLCFVLQTLNSFLPGYFIACSLVIIYILYLFSNKKKALALLSKKNVIAIIVSILLLIPIVLPYFRVSHEFNYVRDIRDTIHLALQFEDYFYTNSYSRLEPLLSSIQPKSMNLDVDFKPGFIGGIFTILAVLSLWYFIKHYKKKNWMNNSVLIISIFGFVMSLGPFLHLFRNTVHYPLPIPLPYAIFYYIMPGFQGIRNSARWEMLFIIAIAIIIAIVLQQFLKKTSFRKKAVIYMMLTIAIIIEFNFPVSYQQVTQKDNFPKVYSWLNTTPTDSVIIEMPIYTWDMQPYVMDENMREYYSTMHFRKMVNGASGFSPDPWQKMVKELLATFPNESSIASLKEKDVDYIIVHKEEYDRLFKDTFAVPKKNIPNGDVVIRTLEKSKSLRLVKKFNNDYVYQIVK